MKYLLINNLDNDDKHACTKVRLNGHDYYVTGDDFHNRNLLQYDLAYHWKQKEIVQVLSYDSATASWLCADDTMRDCYKLQKVIATDNINSSLPTVIPEVQGIAFKWLDETPNNVRWSNNDASAGDNCNSFIEGYKTAKANNSLSEDDVVNFMTWISDNYTKALTNTYMHNSWKGIFTERYTIKELLAIWLEQKEKTLYYE